MKTLERKNQGFLINLNTAKPIGVPIVYPIIPARLPEKIKSFRLNVELIDAAVAEPPTQALLWKDVYIFLFEELYKGFILQLERNHDLFSISLELLLNNIL